MTEAKKVVIIGSGPAGLTAAIYAARARLAPLVIEGDPSSKIDPAGGQLMLTTEVENYPGFPEGIMGPELMERFKKQAARFGAEFVSGMATKVNVGKKPFEVHYKNFDKDADETVHTHALIVATGASAKWLGIGKDLELSGKGVTTCATCDGAFFKGRKVAVVGGGDTAMEEANFLTRYAEKVYVIHRRNEFRASKIMLKRAKDNPKIEFKLNRTVTDIIPEKRYLHSLHLLGTQDDEGKKEELVIGPSGGLFVAIGHSPNVELFTDQLELEENGYLKVKGWSSLSSVEGVFAAGDVHDHHYRQAVTAAGAGCKAAIDAERWLESKGY
ncbi:MAG TPA: thioredoxin-disulfide reductase [Planctomycetota bacterium]|nr:thioredoxin-disulfide reductase [Planctomycetota bacterium]